MPPVVGGIAGCEAMGNAGSAALREGWGPTTAVDLKS